MKENEIGEQVVVCGRCATRYPIVAGIPQIVSPRADNDRPVKIANDQYVDDEIIQTYYEAHYARFFKQTAALRARVTFPYLRARERDGNGPGEALESGSNWALLNRAVHHVAVSPELTEDFYMQMLDWCRPLIHRGGVALDAGCGLGRMTAEIARLGATHVMGIDRSSRMLREAQRIITARKPLRIALNMIDGTKGLPVLLDQRWGVENYDFIMGDVSRLPVRKETIDLVVCLNVVDRIADPRRMVEEFRRVLKPGGHLLIADPYHWDKQFTPRSNWVGDMTTLFPTRRWQLLREADGLPFVLRYYRRRVTIYLNHCLLLQRRATLALDQSGEHQVLSGARLT